MPTDWEHGTRVYLYTEEDPDFARLPVLTRSFAGELLKFGGRIGVIHVGAENAIDVVCRRVGAHAGERRQIRQIIPILIEHEYLVEKPGALVVRNFLVVHYGRDAARLAAMTELREAALTRARLELESGSNRARVVRERSTNRARVRTEPSVTGARVEHESSTSGARVVHESGSKPDATPLNDSTPSGVPSGPVLPSIPIQSSTSGARDGAPEAAVPSDPPVVNCSTVERPSTLNWLDTMVAMRGWSNGILRLGGSIPQAKSFGEVVVTLAKQQSRDPLELAQLLCDFAKANGFAWMKIRRPDTEWFLADDATNLTTSADKADDWDRTGRPVLTQEVARGDPRKGMQPPAPSSSFDDANRAGRAVARDPFGELQFSQGTAGAKR